MEKIIALLKQIWLPVIGAIIGAGGGLAYWYFIGCTDGACPITSSPFLSVIWGALFGGLLFGTFNKKRDV